MKFTYQHQRFSFRELDARIPSELKVINRFPDHIIKDKFIGVKVLRLITPSKWIAEDCLYVTITIDKELNKFIIAFRDGYIIYKAPLYFWRNKIQLEKFKCNIIYCANVALFQINATTHPTTNHHQHGPTAK
jgi:hypothetical protein